MLQETYSKRGLSRAIDLTGKRLGKLTIRTLISRNPRRWVCDCSCGNTVTVRQNALTESRQISCGCQRKAMVAGGLHFKHGHALGSKSSPTHNTWVHIHQRCENPKNAAYERYGGRGIKVCEHWATFANFLADMGSKPAGLSLDRINNDGNYEPGNCRWATPKQQANNRLKRRWGKKPKADAVHSQDRRILEADAQYVKPGEGKF